MILLPIFSVCFGIENMSYFYTIKDMTDYNVQCRKKKKKKKKHYWKIIMK